METHQLFETMVSDLKHIVHRQATPSWCISPQWCESEVLILIYEGVMKYRKNQKNFEAKKGDLIYFKKGDYREAFTDKNALLKCYSVDFSYTCVSYEEGEPHLICPPLPFEGQETIINSEVMNKLLLRFERLSRYWQSKHPKRVYECRIIFAEIIQLLIDYKRGEAYNDHKLLLIEQVTRFMSENYASKLSLKRLAEEASVSPSYLGNLFKEIIGTTPIDYLLYIRIQKAKELIMDGHRISDIAVYVGFADVFQFSKMFKKFVGVAPSKYEKQ